MDKNKKRSKLLKEQETFTRLLDDLHEYRSSVSDELAADTEMLSLAVEEALQGVDIAARFPTFYQKMLNDAHLRQAFLDALESFQESENILETVPERPAPDLSFLADLSRPLGLERTRREQWRISWQQTIGFLQSRFSPAELAFRSDPTLYEDPWINLLREKFEVDGASYTVVLEGTLAAEPEESLDVFLNIAATIKAAEGLLKFPLKATLQWGTYFESLHILKEGRIKFPNVKLPAVFDENYQNIKSGLTLTLETIP